MTSQDVWVVTLESNPIFLLGGSAYCQTSFIRVEVTSGLVGLD